MSAKCLNYYPVFLRLSFHTSLVHTHLEVGERKISAYLWGYLWWDHSLFTQWWVHNPSIYTLFNRTPPLLQEDTIYVHREKKEKHPLIDLIKTVSLSYMIACVYRLQSLMCESDKVSRRKYVQRIELNNIYEFKTSLCLESVMRNQSENYEPSRLVYWLSELSFASVKWTH